MSRYLKQLTEKCKNTSCLRIFCRKVDDFNIAREIAGILDGYGNSLLCKKIEKTALGSEPLPCGDQIVDMYFYTLSLISKPEQRRATSSPFSLRSAAKNVGGSKPPEKTSTKMFRQISISEKKRTISMCGVPYKIKPCQDLNHSFCHIVDKRLTRVDVYILTGVLHLLLWKFHANPDFNLALVIIRLLNVLSKLSMIEDCYFSILVEVFDSIQKKILTSVVPLMLSDDNKQCISSLCLFHFSFTKSDFMKCFNTFRKLIDQSPITDVRVDEGLLSSFEIFQRIYQINEALEMIKDKEFVLRSFFARINVKHELRFAKIRYTSSLNYHFAIPIDVKAEILKIHNNDLMKNTLQDAFFRALFEGITEPYFFISVRRDFVYQDTLKALADANEENVKKQLKVKFLGEEGVDSGGIKKEFFLLLGHEIENDTNLFRQTNNRVWFKKGVDQNALAIIGKIMGISLYNDVVLNVPFPAIIFKKLLGIPLAFEELEEIEPEIYSSLVNLEKCSDKDLEFLDQMFCVDVHTSSGHFTCELVPGGSCIKVTRQNLKEFQKLYAHLLLETLIEDEFRAFSQGFNSIVKYESILNFKPHELEKLIIGSDDYDFEAIRSTTTYNGYDPSSDVIISYFWDFFTELSLHKKKKLIQFITGNDRLPVGGSKSLSLVIMKNGCDTDRLPSSQTCFNTLLLPEYPTRDKLKKKLGKAIDLTAGFFLM